MSNAAKSFMYNFHRHNSEAHIVAVGGSYQLVNNFFVDTDLRPVRDISTERITLTACGRLLIRSGFCWDGVSGPVIDRSTNMRGGLAHDALYMLMRMGKLEHKYWRAADKLFAEIIIEDGCWPITAKIDLAGLAMAQGKAARPSSRRKVSILRVGS